MCWSAPASLIIGAAGIGAAAYAHKKGEKKYIVYPLVYFSLMEFLQLASYFYIGECALTGNTVFTFLSYVHIAFQPIFVNMFMLYSLPRLPSKAMRRFAYGISLAVAALMLIKLVPFVPSSICTLGQTLCGQVMCTMPGSWHLGWSVPYYSVPLPGDALIYYGAAAFLVPLVYGAWSTMAIFIATGPVLAFLLTGGSPNEWPAVWCLYSVTLIIMTLYLHRRRKR